MAENVIKSYLVRVGFEADEPSFRKLDSIMAKAEETVVSHTSGMTSVLLRSQGAIVGGFTAVSAAIVSLADKVAMSDQKYRLMGMRMMMTGESARKLSMITAALGTTMEEAAWDPEVHKSWLEMSGRIDAVTQSLGLFSGGKGEANLKAIRGFHNAFAQLGVDAQLLGAGFVSSLFQKLFPDGGVAAMSKVTEWLNWFEKSIPRWSDQLADKAIPILKDTWLIFKDLGEVIRTGALAFTNLVGLFSGDSSIEGATFSWEKFAGALSHVVGWAKRAADILVDLEASAAHTAAALSMLMHGDFAGASKSMELAKAAMSGAAQRRGAQAAVDDARDELAAAKTPAATAAAQQGLSKALAAQKAENESTHWGAPVLGGGTALTSLAGTAAAGMLLKRLFTGAVTAGVNAEGAAGLGMGGMLMGGSALAGLGAVAMNYGHSADWIAHYSGLDRLYPAGMSAYNKALYGGGAPAAAGASTGTGTGDLPGALAKAIAQIESGGNPRALNFRNFNPGNLRRWGNTPTGEGGFAKFASMEEGEAAELQMINKLIGKGLTLRELLGGKKGVYAGWAPRGDNNDPDAYARSVSKRLGIDPDVPLSQLSMGYMNKSWAAGVNQASGKQEVNNTISLGGVYITRPNAEPHEIQTAVTNGVRDGLRSQTQFDMAQVAAPAW